jgi:hypothetical protein
MLPAFDPRFGQAVLGLDMELVQRRRALSGAKHLFVFHASAERHNSRRG